MHGTPPLQVLIDKLDSYAALADDDRRSLSSLSHFRKAVSGGTYLVREGTTPEHCAVLLEGYAIRHKLSLDGGRQIVSLQIPGDPLDVQHLFLDRADHNIQALGPATVAMIPFADLRALVMARPGLIHAFAICGQIEASILQEWLLNVGRRNAQQRLVHLFCEISVRLENTGHATRDGFILPMTQEELGDSTSLTAVHVNRSLMALERGGWIERNGRTISFPNRAAAIKMAGFNPQYLHHGRQRVTLTEA